MRHIEASGSGDLPTREAAQGGKASAFTLIELLAILAVLGLLACVLAPGLARTAPNSTAAQCQNNLRQLIGAWVMYAGDNSGQLVHNREGATAGARADSENWVTGWLDFTTRPDNTNTAMLINHQLYPYGAFLGPYLKSPRPFKCPADKSVVPLGPSGQRIPRVRSVSMNNRIGEGARSWSSPSAYLMYSTLSGISKPAPAQLLVLLDELPESLNDGCFFTDPDAVWQIMDFPATGHNGGAGFAFADGHSEVHRWKDSRTMPLIAQGGITPGNVASPGNVDLQWLHEHAAARR